MVSSWCLLCVLLLVLLLLVLMLVDGLQRSVSSASLCVTWGCAPLALFMPLPCYRLRTVCGLTTGVGWSAVRAVGSRAGRSWPRRRPRGKTKLRRARCAALGRVLARLMRSLASGRARVPGARQRGARRAEQGAAPLDAVRRNAASQRVNICVPPVPDRG